MATDSLRIVSEATQEYNFLNSREWTHKKKLVRNKSNNLIIASLLHIPSIPRSVHAVRINAFFLRLANNGVE